MAEALIHYKAGYKYQLVQRVRLQLPFAAPDWARIPGPDGQVMATLSPSGLLVIEPLYAWDGPSGPAIDTPAFMAASLVHDVLYQMIRLGQLPHEWREKADEIMRRLCIGAGMWPIRAWWCWYGVHRAAGFAAEPAAEPRERTAPLVLAVEDKCV
jgi:hypothetical protein